MIGVQLSGKWIIVVILIGTPLVKLWLLYIYPKVIMPLSATFTDIPQETDEEKNLVARINALAKRVKFDAKHIVLEETIDADMHSNASCVFGRVHIGDQLLKHHKGNEAEILSILAHEFGHWKKNHLMKTLIIDMTQSFFTGILLMFFVNDVAFLTSFKFKHESFAMSVFMIVTVYDTSISEIIGFFERWLSRRHEKEADEYAVELGYGEFLYAALIRNQKEN